MRAAFVLIVQLMLTSVESQSIAFLVNPVSIAAVDGTTVEFSCTANNSEEVSYRVNGSSAGDQSVENKGFVELGAEVFGTVRRTNLTVTISSQYNNTEIFCRAIGTNNNVNSETATLTVQGPLSSVGDLSRCYINSSTVNISWSPPFTLPGTTIIGYNISVTSNGTLTTYHFTSDSYHVLQFNDITDSPCNEINITLSGYNGLNGQTDTISGIYLPSIPSSDVDIPFRTEITSNWYLILNMTVTNLCIGERPSSVDVDLFSSDTLVDSVDDLMLPQDTDANVLTINTTLTVLEDKKYTALVSLSNLGGVFSINISINISDTIKPTVTSLRSQQPITETVSSFISSSRVIISSSTSRRFFTSPSSAVKSDNLIPVYVGVPTGIIVVVLIAVIIVIILGHKKFGCTDAGCKKAHVIEAEYAEPEWNTQDGLYAEITATKEINGPSIHEVLYSKPYASPSAPNKSVTPREYEVINIKNNGAEVGENEAAKEIKTNNQQDGCEDEEFNVDPPEPSPHWYLSNEDEEDFTDDRYTLS